MRKINRKKDHFLDVPAHKVAELCGVSGRTVARWIATGQCPKACREWIEANRDRRVIPPRLAGQFVIRDDGGIGTRTGYSISWSQLETYGWHLAAFYRQERLHRLAIKAMREDLDRARNALKDKEKTAQASNRLRRIVVVPA